MLRHRHFADHGPQFFQPRNSGTHLAGHLWIEVRQLEAFAENADLQALDTSVQGLGIGLDLRCILARIQPVCPCNDFEHQGVVAHVGSNGPRMVDGRLDLHDACIGH
ncbi:hypothetical protein JL05_02595 [Serratia nematodiphila DZ0503SBS1]|nr:hypothetical protein JL05_02595 [Serratia nematodiphila DZ0503SBS1]